MQIKNKANKNSEKFLKFLLENYHDFNGNPDEDVVIVNNEEMVITKTTKENKDDNENRYFNLGECENILKNYYNIPANETLYITQLYNEKDQNNSHNMEFEVRAKIMNNTFLKLDTSLCSSIKIKLSFLIDVDFSDIQFILKYETYETRGENETQSISYYDKVYKYIERFLSSNEFNSSYFNNKIIETKRMNVTLTNSYIQNLKILEKYNFVNGCEKHLKFHSQANNARNLEKIKEYHRLVESVDSQQNNNNTQSMVYLGECENSLRNFYNLSGNETIYMKILDVSQKGMSLTKTEFDVYHLSKNKLTKLNISVCNKDEIFLVKPQKLFEDDIDKVNIKSGYYNDICYSTTSESGTDIILEDRKKIYIKDNKAVCQEECDFYGYNDNTENVFCSCKARPCPSSFIDMYINKTKLFENLLNIKNIANIHILGCYKILFTKKGIIYNIGSYIIIIIFFFHIICIFIFYLKKWRMLINKIEDIEFGLNNLFLNIADENKKQKNNENKKIKKKKKKSGKVSIKISKIKNQKNENIQTNNNNYIIVTNNNDSKKIQKSKNENQSIDKLNKKITDKDLIEKVNKIMIYNEDEINKFPYELAKKKDLRTYCSYYISLVKTKHNLVFSIFYDKDYNPKIVKVNLLVISFTLFYTINALFYTNDTMHKIYENHGSFNIEYHLPKIIYSSFISSFLNYLLKFLALSNDKILDFKNSKSKSNISNTKIILINQIRIRFILYFIIGFIFLVFCWYYVAMFGVVYKNTQIHLLKDTLISFSLSLLYPFGIYLLPGIFRIPSLSNSNKNRKCLYNFSKMF